MERIASSDRTSEGKYGDKEDGTTTSILVKTSRDDFFSTTGKRQGSGSKATIQWEEGVLELNKKSKLHALNLMRVHGSKWSYVEDIMTKLKTEETKNYEGDESHRNQRLVSSKGFDTFLREAWFNMAKAQSDKQVVDLTLDQQTKLEIVKMKCKKENMRYLKRHRELGVLLSLVYRKLFKTRPEDPKVFVANYVHHLNLNREELVLGEMDVPFDKPVHSEEESISGSKERIEIETLARELLDMCVDIASKGEAFVNVRNIMNSVLRQVSPSEDDVGARESMRSAERAINSIISSLLNNTMLHNIPSSEVVVDQILSVVIHNVCPSVDEDSSVVLEMRESIQVFIESILKDVTDKVFVDIGESETMRNLNDDTVSIRSKGILRLNSNIKETTAPRKGSREHVLVKAESKVKFQSLM